MDYKTKRWRSKRESILARDRCQCRECRRFGVLADASVVHHAYPAEEYPEYAWRAWNLVSLCASCHNAMHDRETGALTDRGLAWRRRVSPPPPPNMGGPRKTGGQDSFRRREIRERGSPAPRIEPRGHGAPANDAPA